MFSKKHSYKILFASNSILSHNRRSFNHLSKSSIPRLKLVSCNGRKFFQNEKFTSYVLFTTQHRRTYATSENNVVESKFGTIDIPDSNLPQYIWRDIKKWPTKPMITCGITGRSYTYEKGRQMCTLFARALVSKLKLKKGDVVGLLLPNIPEYVLAIHGAMEAGMIVTFVNPLYTPSEIKRQFENADVKYAVTIPELLSNLEAAISESSHYRGTIVINKPEKTESKFDVHDFGKLIASQAESESVPLYTPSSEDIAVLPYSSGTTGLPKGVMLTHKNCVANLMQLDHDNILSYKDTTDTFQEISLTVLPFFHIYGFNSILNLAVNKGLHLVTMPKFVPEAYIKCLQQYKPNLLFVVPSLLLFLASHPSVKPEYLASVREIVSGAAPASKSLIENFRNKFNHDELVIRQGYGMTELSPCALLSPLNLGFEKHGSAGVLIRDTKARVVSLKDGKNQPAYESGELYIKGPQVMKGYWKNDKATEEILDKDGWLRTGDVVYYDNDEFFYVIDRTKELIKVKGNQVSPTELEGIILKLPEIADVAVVGIPDTLADEIPKAFVVLKQNAQISAEKIIDHVNQQVVHYKKLAGGVAFINAIPRNVAGKILRNELKVLGGK
ncbi:probable 4-coumarate--CoA ligase 1 [Planococcus citri]|uniref:probable 4-coumarate--CoA ligase 1 n=1 Tax=Planococcus citri TaxID=170843 RepID=UPI0031F8750B